MNTAMLVRDHLSESVKAAKLLEKNRIKFTELYASAGEGKLPFLISPESAFAFMGLGQIRIFVVGAIQERSAAKK